MIQAVLALLTSRAKWAKLLVLLRERGIMGVQTLYRILGVQEGSDVGPHASMAGSGLVVRTHHEQWEYVSRVRMPVELLDGQGTRFRQDSLQADDTLQSIYVYQSAVYQEASFYSNGTSHVTLFDWNDKRVAEFSYAKYGRAVPATRRLPIKLYLHGTTLSLYGNVENTAGNIGHWMIDGISRLFLALRHHKLEEIDHVLVPRLKYGYQKESLVELGIPAEKIVEIDVLQCVRCERLLVTTAPRGYSSSSTPGWLIDGFRQRLLPARAATSTPERIYISRRDAGSRKFVNEDEIIACLESYGFVAVEMSDYDFNEKIALFSQASMVVGLTGAGLTNLMFCPSDASIVELFPESYVTYFYTSMACYLGLDYHYIVFENDSMLSSMNKYYGNLSLNTDVLSRKIEGIIAQRGWSKQG